MMIKKHFRIYVLVLLVILSFGAFAGGEDPLRYVHLSEDVFSFAYAPPVNGEYAVYAFSVDDAPVSCNVRIMEGDTSIAAGSGIGEICTARLAAQSQYVIEISGSGYAAVEIARNAPARCYSDPLDFKENDRKSKMIARSGDAHWYRFTAEEDSFLLLSCVPEDPGINLGALLVDDCAHLIAEFEPLSGGACILRAETQRGRDYFIRVYSPEGSVGYYSLSALRPDNALIQSPPEFNAASYTLSRNHSLDLRSCLSGSAYLFTSRDTSICSVSPEGIVTGLREGSTIITAYGFSTQAQCRIDVVNIPIESIDILSDRIVLPVGDEADAPVVVGPENASSGLLIYTVEDPDIASVSGEGIVTGLKPGCTVLHVATTDAGISDTCQIIVEEAPPRFRALLIGEENYPSGVNEMRPGTLNAIRAIDSVLAAMDMNGEKYITSSRLDLTRSEFIAAIRDTFSGASEKDVSLIYISCHGQYDSGNCCLQFVDGSVFPVHMLERELRAVPGKIVLLLDCCASGGAIGAGSDHALYRNQMGEAFSSDAFASTKYLVLCSTALDRESYRIALNNDPSSMTTVFARALCDGLGWDIDTGEKVNMRADLNDDDRVTFGELFEYLSERVDLYMNRVSETTGNIYIQSITANAPIDPFILFMRENS